MMGQSREFRLVFLLVFGIWFALEAVTAGMWAFGIPAGMSYQDWSNTYNLVSSLSRAAEVAAMVILLIALYRHLLLPRATPLRPLLGLLIALVGVLLSLVSIGFLSGIQGDVYRGIVAVTFFSFPLFLFGIGLMFLRGSPPEAVPVMLAPQMAPSPPPVTQPAPPAHSEIGTGPWGPP